jgi:hypothetical protein
MVDKAQNPFMQAFAERFEIIGDTIAATLPEGARFCLFVTGPEGGQAGLVSNITQESVISLITSWVESKQQNAVLSLRSDDALTKQ